MKLFKNILLRILGEKNYLFFFAYMFQRLYKTGKLGLEYQDVYFLKHIIRNGDYVVDIGAHLGYYTFELSRLTGQDGRVIAIEPVSKFNRVIGKMISKYKFSKNISLQKVALGGSGKFVEIGIPIVGKEKKFGYARIKELSQHLDYAESEKVPNVDGDELFAGLIRLDFITCDVEGAEVPVFKSLLATIARHAPILLCELADKQERIRMFELLKPWNYKSYLLKNGILLELDVFSDNLAISHNHYFIPPERIGYLKNFIHIS